MEPGGNVGIGTTIPKSRRGIKGGVAVGATYSETNVAPADGLIVQGSVGIGMTTPANRLDVYGKMAVGRGYAGTPGPADGLVVQGHVGIGTTVPETLLDLFGADKQLFFSNASVPTRAAISLNSVRPVGGGGGLHFQRYATAANGGAFQANVMTVDIGNERVGIGTITRVRDSLGGLGIGRSGVPILS
jgi:hypothetical protein